MEAKSLVRRFIVLPSDREGMTKVTEGEAGSPPSSPSSLPSSDDHDHPFDPLFNEVLDAFRCPITGEIMSDPVLTMDGRAFERSAIEAWFSEGNTASPVTKEELESTRVIPAVTLKRAIDEYAQRVMMLQQNVVEAQVLSVDLGGLVFDGPTSCDGGKGAGGGGSGDAAARPGQGVQPIPTHAFTPVGPGSQSHPPQPPQPTHTIDDAPGGIRGWLSSQTRLPHDTVDKYLQILAGEGVLTMGQLCERGYTKDALTRLGVRRSHASEILEAAYAFNEKRRWGGGGSGGGGGGQPGQLPSGHPPMPPMPDESALQHGGGGGGYGDDSHKSSMFPPPPPYASSAAGGGGGGGGGGFGGGGGGGGSGGWGGGGGGGGGFGGSGGGLSSYPSYSSTSRDDLAQQGGPDRSALLTMMEQVHDDGLTVEPTGHPILVTAGLIIDPSSATSEVSPTGPMDNTHALFTVLTLLRNEPSVVFVACRALCRLTADKGEGAHAARRRKLGSLGACEVLISIIGLHITRPRVIEAGFDLVVCLALEGDNQRRLVDAGAVGLICRAMHTFAGERGVQYSCMWAVARLAYQNDAHRRRFKREGVKSMIKGAVMRFHGDREIRRRAKKALDKL